MKKFVKDDLKPIYEDGLTSWQTINNGTLENLTVRICTIIGDCGSIYAGAKLGFIIEDESERWQAKYNEEYGGYHLRQAGFIRGGMININRGQASYCGTCHTLAEAKLQLEDSCLWQGLIFHSKDYEPYYDLRRKLYRYQRCNQACGKQCSGTCENRSDYETMLQLINNAAKELEEVPKDHPARETMESDLKSAYYFVERKRQDMTPQKEEIMEFEKWMGIDRKMKEYEKHLLEQAVA